MYTYKLLNKVIDKPFLPFNLMQFQEQMEYLSFTLGQCIATITPLPYDHTTPAERKIIMSLFYSELQNNSVRINSRHILAAFVDLEDEMLANVLDRYKLFQVVLKACKK